MGKSTKNLFTDRVKSVINSNIANNEYKLFVFLGITDYIDINRFEDYLLDRGTFLSNGNESVFTKEWRKEMNRAIMREDNGYGIMSYQQFCYCEANIGEDYRENVVIIQDNLRSIFPLDVSDYITVDSDEAHIDVRPDELPIFQAEQFDVDSKYFYSVKYPSATEYTIVNLFEDQTPLNHNDMQESIRIIDLQNDSYDLDMFINECIEKGSFNKTVGVKSYNKHPLSKVFRNKLELINTLLGIDGGALVEIEEQGISNTYTPRVESSKLLREYWGANATFRDIQIYKNPDCSKELINISQGQIVDTIIDEYEHAKDGAYVRDLFLTASTGAGKSLLFQIPAFHIAGQGDVTIVVSPLIALMGDQVESIRRKGFNKVEYLNSDINLNDRERIIAACKNGEVDVLYMAPELLLSYDISFFIGARRLGLIVVDEAHLITTWGRDFRIDYWHLGGHVKKMRKRLNYDFPIVAVTATAVYGGDNDMVFDTIDSLKMKQPHIFIGKIKRDNITFVINNHDVINNHYEAKKAQQTADFIADMAIRGIKTIVYVPYRRHIDKINALITNVNVKDKIAIYHAGMKKDDKKYNMSRFQTNNAIVMICTKAFGMGVDIPDIQVVYHHAPSGVLPDYVQEIGRVARDEKLEGFAALNYAEQDQYYSKALYGMSAIKSWQIKAVLKKLNEIFIANGKKRNMLISTDDFKHIFPNADNDTLSQNVQTALMMIEKDYLAKVRFNVLIARPKKLFAHVYASTDMDGHTYLMSKYADAINVISENNGNYILRLELDKIWRESFSDMSFPSIKFLFYSGRLFENIKLLPEQRFSFDLNLDYSRASDIYRNLLNALETIFGQHESHGHAFTEKEMVDELDAYISDRNISQQIAAFILNTYSDLRTTKNDAFLQERKRIKDNTEKEYIVKTALYGSCIARLKTLFAKLFENGNAHAVRYAIINGDAASNYARIGCIMDLLGIGTYECRGGDNPVVFIRINDPQKIARDANNPSYTNTILTKTDLKHKTSSAIFDHFFTNVFTNAERWDYIEDFFLGMDYDELIVKYKATNRSNVDIVKVIESRAVSMAQGTATASSTTSSCVVFSPEDGAFYTSDRFLTIDGVTMKIAKWIEEDPVKLHKVLKAHEIKIPRDWYTVMMSKMRAKDPAYYRNVMGLYLPIEFPGYKEKIIASIPYKDLPLKFYNWWKKNEDVVYLSKLEIINLFNKVKELGGSLQKKHEMMLATI